VEVSGKSRQILEYDCKSSLQPKGDMTLISLNCKSQEAINFKVPEESTFQCLKTIVDSKNRAVILINSTYPKVENTKDFPR
jgi:hypothetical protein